MSAHEPIIGVLLAGGRSSRFGGGDKCLSALAGKPLLAHAIERFRPQVETLVLNANGDARRFASFGLPVIADYASARIGDFAGPLAGVLAGMEWTRAHRPEARCRVTAATDTPFFPLDLVARLAEAADGRALAVAKSESGVHPVSGYGLSRLRRRCAQTSRRESARCSIGRGSIARWRSRSRP
jgi:molybdopterin-guanine dinucleotide biosynthesis protein A